MFLWVLTSIYPLQVFGIYLTRFKEFRTFWPCSFVDPSVKVTDNFWTVRGLVDRFNESRKHIASEVEKTYDELISAIQFRTTPKGYLLHYSYFLGIYHMSALIDYLILYCFCWLYEYMWWHPGQTDKLYWPLWFL